MKAILLSFVLTCSMFYIVRAQYNLDLLANLKIVGAKYDIKTPEKVAGVILYQQAFVSDTTKPDVLQIDTTALSYGQHFADYRLNEMRLLDSLVSTVIDRVSRQNLSNRSTESIPQYNLALSKERFLTEGENVYAYQDLFDNHYLIRYIRKKIDWIIKDSTREICGFTCQKAEADILGRHYIAWFTTDIPSSFGPRTLVGLPGMILCAYDALRQIKYEAMAVLPKSDPGLVIGLPVQGIYCSKYEYDAMIEVFDKDPRAFFNGQKDIAVGKARIANGDFKPNKKNKKNRKNSIELKMED